MKTAVEVELDLGMNEFALIKGDDKSVTFDLHQVVNNDDGWLDGFELTWDEIYSACKDWMKKDSGKCDHRSGFQGGFCGWCRMPEPLKGGRQ